MTHGGIVWRMARWRMMVVKPKQEEEGGLGRLSSQPIVTSLSLRYRPRGFANLGIFLLVFPWFSQTLLTRADNYL